MTERINSSSSSRSAHSSVFANSASSYKASEGLDYFEGIAIRPPSGTNHQQPGSHLSVDTRLEQLSLESVSWIAKSETDAQSQSRCDSRSAGFNQDRSLRRYKVVVPKPNCYTVSPFKQGPEAKRTGPVLVVDPSHELKQQTIAKVKKTREKLRSAKPPRAPVSLSAQLTKEKLRHMGRPMTASGPPIGRCRGIFAGAAGRYRVCSPGPRFPFELSAGLPTKQYSTTPSSRTRSPSLRPESSLHVNSCASSVQDSNCDCPTEESDIVDLDDTLIGAWPVGGDDSEGEFVSVEDAGCGENQGSYTEHTRNHDCLAKEEFAKNPERCKPTEDLPIRRSSDDDEDDGDDCGYSGTRSNCFGDNGGSNVSRITETSDLGKNSDRVNDGGTQDELKLSSSSISCNSFIERGGYKNAEKVLRDVKTQEEKVVQDSSTAPNSENLPIKYNFWDSGNENGVPVMEVHIKRTARQATDISPTTKSECTRCEEVTPLEFGTDSVGLVDGDELDTDRIPSAFLWKTLDTLSMSSADLGPDLNGTKFSSENRPVKSAGCGRRSRLNSQNDSKSKKTTSRLRSGKLKEGAKKGKTGSDEKEDLNEFSRVLLGDKSGSKLATTLPGYFKEQYKNILSQQEKASENSDDSSGKHESEKETDVKSKTEEGHGEVSKKFPDLHHEEKVREDTRLGRVSREEEKQGYSEGTVCELKSSPGVFFTVEEGEDSGVETTSQFTERSSFAEFTEGAGTSLEDGLDCKVMFETSNPDKRHEEPHELEVVASAKHLSEPRYLKQKKALAPFPPVCFSINAQPPAGSVFYFAYGADMNPKRMAIHLRREIKFRFWGVLFGFRLCFDKKGNSTEAGGFPNVQFSPADSIEGCVYTISGLELSMLDNCVGYPKHYTRAVLPVWMLNCKDPCEHGVAQYCVPAVIYVAQDEWVVHGNDDPLGSKFSINQCLKARDILSPNYVAFLSSLVS